MSGIFFMAPALKTISIPSFQTKNSSLFFLKFALLNMLKND